MGKEYRVVFDRLPADLEEMKAMPQAGLRTPADTAALTVAALCAYAASPEKCYEMLDFLRGPRPLSPLEKQFIRDRFMDGRDYIPRSYFEGAVPENDYTPGLPLTLVMKDNEGPVADPGYARLALKSGGADSLRIVTLRSKPSTGQWFLWDQMLLGGIRIPKSLDEWA